MLLLSYIITIRTKILEPLYQKKKKTAVPVKEIFVPEKIKKKIKTVLIIKKEIECVLGTYFYYY